MMRHDGKQYLLTLAIYPVLISILLATLWFSFVQWEPICGSSNFSSAETEETLEALSSFGGFGNLAKQLKDQPRELLFASLVAVISFLVSVILITFALLCLYRHGLEQFIRYWMTVSTAVVLCLIGGTLLIRLCQFLCIPLDWLSICFMTWNFSVGGVVAIFYYAPRWMYHGYLIVMASLLSWLFRDFPRLVVGLLLAGLATWDIYAVLSPRGPLRDMVEIAHERGGQGTEFPSLVYDTCPFDMHCIRQIEQREHFDSSRRNSSPFSEQPEETCLIEEGSYPCAPGSNATREENTVENESGTVANNRYIKIGLGDFVFYCLLVAKSSESNMLTWFFCLCSVIVGFFWTLVLLLGYRKALPALPISIFLGLLAYWISMLVTYPFSKHFISTTLFL